MSMTHEPLALPRFTVSMAGGTPEITIPAKKDWSLLALLGFWLCGWTVGGILAFDNLRSGAGQSGQFWPMLLWLGIWLIGEVLMGYCIVWFLTGAEIARIRGSNLELVHRILGYERKRSFRGLDIRNLSAREPDSNVRRKTLATPLGSPSHTSCVKFDYGARTVYFAMGLDEAEGRQIVEQLKRHLPVNNEPGP